MALRTRCITAEKLPDDGLRISVMSAHILSDGITHIRSDMFDEWWRMLSPPLKTRWLYDKGAISWDEFARQYQGYSTSLHVQFALRRLIRIAREGNVTILCSEQMPDHCHRRLIAETCQWLDNTLDVLIE